MDLLIVGSGFFGLTIAERAASVRSQGHRDRSPSPHRRQRIQRGRAETGIEVHRYGAHLFHTSNPTVWEYVNRFTTFTNYVHRVYTNHRGVVFPAADQPRNDQPVLPGGVLARRGEGAHPRARGRVRRQGSREPRGEGHRADRSPAVRGVHPRLHRQAVADRSEGPSRRGHQSASRALQLRQPLLQRHVGGAADRWLHRMDRADGRPPEHRGEARRRLLRRVAAAEQGRRPSGSSRSSTRVPSTATSTTPRAPSSWRTLDFEQEVLDVGDFQGTSVMNYADADVPYTRIHEFKHFHPERADRHPADKTVIMREFSRFADARRRAVLPGQHRRGPRWPPRLPRAREGREGCLLRRPAGHLPVPRHAHGHRLRAVDVEQPARAHANDCDVDGAGAAHDAHEMLSGNPAMEQRRMDVVRWKTGEPSWLTRARFWLST